MKFLSKILLTFILAAVLVFNPSLGCFTQQAVELSDAELDNLFAGGLNIDINAVEAKISAVTAQSNIGALYSQCGDITSSSVNNTNTAYVFNIGNSAIASQNNIALTVAKEGDIDSVTLRNFNFAEVENTGIDESGSGGVNLNQLNISGAGLDFRLNNFNSSNSALAIQSNIAAAVALNGNISNLVIDNSNFACVRNSGNSALAVQNNIGMAIAPHGDISDTVINNTNIAHVFNDATSGIAGGVDAFSLDMTMGSLDITINGVTTNLSASAIQSNIGIIAVGNGHSITNSTINNYNNMGG
ncbi:MAG: hypothetical protein JW867_03315, partial [Candidatus Omnitrophica bacterium]|nr:hypothetical protein [Candidatus Omnitrophota bacterium]